MNIPGNYVLDNVETMLNYQPVRDYTLSNTHPSDCALMPNKCLDTPTFII